jgi:hypothetical protein
MEVLDTCPEADETPLRADTPSAVVALRHELRDFAINSKPDPKLKRDLKPGFLLPYLLDFDALTYGRWDYWFEAVTEGKLPDRPIPPVDFLSSADPRTRKMLETTLNIIPRHGSWQTMGGWDYFRYLLRWMLWGFGHPGYKEPEEPDGCEGACLRVYQTLNICAWMLWPYEYLGDLLAENAYGKGQGFFPTPMDICSMMTQMLMSESDEDMRTKTVCDPAVGTGRFLLTASNYSLRLYGQDIDPLMCMATLVNGYLFSPWLVRPFPFLDGDLLDPAESQRVSDSIAAQAPPHIVEQIGETEHDSEEAFRFEPIKKRRRSKEADVRQGSLF